MRRSLSADALFRVGLEKMRASGSAELLEEALNSVRERVKEARSNVWAFEMPGELKRPFILSGYRKDHDLWSCLRSLFQLHNETINVWSHAVGCGLFAVQLYYLSSTSCGRCEMAGGKDGAGCSERWPLYAFLASALVCLSCSAVYHLCGTANERWTVSLASLDYMGIVALIVGSCLPVCWYGIGPLFPYHRTIYLNVIIALGVAVISCSFTKWFDRSFAHVLLFFALAGAGVLAILHAMFLHDFNPAVLDLLWGVMQMGATYVAGVGVYATHFPESVAPSQFLDVIGSSHQWWHLAVIIAAFQHFHVVVNLWKSSGALQLHPCNQTFAAAESVLYAEL